MSTLKDFLNEERIQLSQFGSADSLVNFQAEKNGYSLTSFESEYRLEISGNLRKILQIIQKDRKQFNLDSLCLGDTFLHWELEEKKILTPVFLHPASWEYLRATDKLKVAVDQDDFVINPFLLNRIEVLFEEKISAESDKEAFIHDLINVLQKQDLIFEIKSDLAFASFHYHRFFALREIEAIQLASSFGWGLEAAFGEKKHDFSLWNKPQQFLASDVDQTAVVLAAGEGNVCVQGPPGTGKTQVITQLVCNALFSKKSVLILSEKDSALSVIDKKLEEIGLSRFALKIEQEKSSKKVMEKLKLLWNQENSIEINGKTEVSQLKFQQMTLLMERLNQKDLLGGLSFSAYQKRRKSLGQKVVDFKLNVPTIQEFDANKDFLSQLSTSEFRTLSKFKATFFSDKDCWERLQILLSNFSDVEQEIGNLNFQDLSELQGLFPVFQLMESAQYSYLKPLLENEKKKDRFLKLVNELQFWSNKLEDAKAQLSYWKRIPSLSEIEQLKSGKAGLFSRMSKEERVLRKDLLNTSLSKEKWVSETETYYQTKEKHWGLLEKLQAFSAPMDLNQLRLDVIILNQNSRLKPSSFQKASDYSVNLRVSLLKKQEKISFVYKSLSRFFNIDPNMSIISFLRNLENEIATLFVKTHDLIQLPNSFFELFYLENIHVIENCVLYSNWQKSSQLFPELSKFQDESIFEKLDEVLKEQNENSINLLSKIRSTQFNQIETLKKLELTPSVKLNEQDKKIKQALKNGKRILVREMNKQRNHLSMKNLLASDAKVWLDAFFPLIMTSPKSLAQQLTVSENSFDLLLIDEASQMPLGHALGALHRSRRFVIFGDEQQMSAKSEFGKTQTMDVLHHAQFYAKNLKLKHHYRSVNHSLIAFSNQYFYQNELMVFPSIEQNQSVFSYYTEEGRFIDQRNLTEAKNIAHQLSFADWNKSIGIVAFSEEQLKAIWEACSSTVRNKITEQEELNKGFFLALENLQGEEADVVFISLGYAKNEQDEFQMRFGPLNHAGGHKRLNVLLTRARNELHFFHSVKSSDFPYSANHSVELLKKYIVFLEQNSSSTEIVLPLLKTFQIEGDEIRAEVIYEQIPILEELLVIYQMMKIRGWKWRV